MLLVGFSKQDEEKDLKRILKGGDSAGTKEGRCAQDRRRVVDYVAMISSFSWLRLIFFVFFQR